MTIGTGTARPQGKRDKQRRQRKLIDAANAVFAEHGYDAATTREVAERAGYSSAEEFMRHLLEKAVADVEQAATDEEVEKQLRGLGYIE